jgi:type VI secretion system protein ImpK
MRRKIANLVYPVLSYGLRLKERVERGEPVDFDTEQTLLKGLLLDAREAGRWADFGGEGGPVRDVHLAREGDVRGNAADTFLGVRYALVCWLDELFTLDSPWQARWNERKLEMELYGTNDRAWKFWDQAGRADTRRGSDALEVFFLCVALGFRGALGEEPDKLQAWLSATRARIGKVRALEGADVSAYEPPTRVPPLHGPRQMQTMLLAGGTLLLLSVPLVAFFLVQRLGQ